MCCKIDNNNGVFLKLMSPMIITWKKYLMKFQMILSTLENYNTIIDFSFNIPGRINFGLKNMWWGQVSNSNQIIHKPLSAESVTN